MGDHRVYRDHRYEFGTQLLTLRTRIALTQLALAQQIGVHRRSVQNWETGISYPKAETLQRIIEVFLRHHAFLPGDERTEALALWERAAHDAPHTLASFDEGWFARALESHTATQAGGAQPSAASPAPQIAAPPRIIDWGEALAAPALYGRDEELQTLRQWIVEDRCRVVALVGLGGIGKSSLAITVAQQVVPQFDVVLFHSLQNGPPLAEVIDQTIRAIADQPLTPPEPIVDKVALLVQFLRERRCLIILDNFESILQPGAIAGTYRTGYDEYGGLLRALGEREHQSCLLLTSREKPAEFGPLEGRTAPVRSLALAGLDDGACDAILRKRDIVGTTADVDRLVHLYGGNPLALHLVTEPIRELFGGSVDAFLAAGDAFFNGLDRLMEQQCARTTPLEHAIIRWLAIERELVHVESLLINLGESVPKRDVLVALESLRRRVQIEHGSNQLGFTLQPAILEFVTNQMLGVVCQEIVAGQPALLCSHALIQATARDYVRRSQEQLIARPLLERLAGIYGDAAALEGRLLALLDTWRGQPLTSVGYGPSNVINLLRLLRGHLRSMDASRLALRGVFLQGVEMQDADLSGAIIRDSLFTETFDVIQAVAVSSSGAYWGAATRRGEVIVWESGNLSAHRMWRAHTDMAWSLAFSPDERLVASCSWDGTVKLSDVSSGTVIWAGHHASHVNSAAFSPDGATLASGGNDAIVRLWDVRSGTQLQALQHPSPVSGCGVTWSPDGRLLASGDLEGAIRVWRLSSDDPAACALTIAAHTTLVDGLAFSPDGRMLASTSWDGTVKIWDAATGQMAELLTGHTGRTGRVAWSPDGRTLAVSSYDPTIWLWDVARRTYRETLHGHTDGVCGLVFTPDSRTLLSCGNGMLRVWDLNSGQSIHALQGYAESLNVVDWSPDGSQLVSGGMDAIVTIWDASGKQARALHGHRGSVCGVGWSPDGHWLASSQWENAIRLWNPTSGACDQVLQHPTDAGNIFYGLVWSPDSRRIACGTSRRGVLVWDVHARRQGWADRQHPTFIRHIAWRPDGSQLAGGGDDGVLYIWDADTGALLQRLVGHNSMITSVAWSPDGGLLASGGRGQQDGELFLWRAERWERVDTLGAHAGVVYSLAWGASSDVLITGGGDGSIRWWDTQRGECVLVRDAHKGTVQSLRRSSDSARLASCGDDGAIAIWDLHTGVRLQTLRRDRPYERLAIAGMSGLTAAQKASLIALGALDQMGDQPRSTSIGARSLARGDHAPSDMGNSATLSLPFQSTPFFGRGAEIMEIARLLANPACRLVTLLGPGGIGKTRLALQVAERFAANVLDGVAFVELAAVDTPDQIVSAIGEALGISLATQPSPTAALISYLRERQMLLVLDSFEHLLPGSELITTILERTPHTVILITSRERLRLQAEWLFDVQGLTYPEQNRPGSNLSRGARGLADYSAIQLFVQRAAQIQPGFAPSEPHLAIVARICHAVAGMPLAIELAAAGLRTLPLGAIEEQIRANLDALATTLRDVPARHRSMRAVFDHSWDLLSERERALFRRLSAFQNGCTTAAAVRVAGATPATLTALVDKSLVRQAHVASRATPGAAEPRFVLLEPLREYAAEQLAARGEAHELRQSHARYYLELAEAAAADGDTPMGVGRLALLDHEDDNLRAVLQWSRDQGDLILGLQLAGALRKYWRRRGATSEGRAWLEELLARSDHRDDPAALSARVRALEAAGWLASDQHEYARATQLFEQGIALRRMLGEPGDETRLWGNAALEARSAGNYEQATAWLEDMVARQRALPERRSLSDGGLGLSLFLLGLVQREQGDYAQAAALFADCLALHRGLGDREGVAAALLGLSDIARDQGDISAVRTYALESRAILQELGAQWAIGFAHNNLAIAGYLEGDIAGASALVGESVALFRSQQAEGSLAEVLITMGQVMLAQGDRAAAYAALREALEFARTAGPRLMVAAALEALADVVGSQHAEIVTRLLALASAMRAQMRTPVRPIDQPGVSRSLAAARASLGANICAAIWAEAQRLPLEQIIGALPEVEALTRLRERSRP